MEGEYEVDRYTEEREFEADLQDVTDHLYGKIRGKGDRWWLENASAEILVDDGEGGEVEKMIPIRTIDDVPEKYNLRRDSLRAIERYVEKEGFETHSAGDWKKLDAVCVHEGGIPRHCFI